MLNESRKAFLMKLLNYSEINFQEVQIDSSREDVTTEKGIFHNKNPSTKQLAMFSKTNYSHLWNFSRGPSVTLAKNDEAPPLSLEREKGGWKKSRGNRRVKLPGEEIVDNTETRKKFDLQARILNSRGG